MGIWVLTLPYYAILKRKDVASDRAFVILVLAMLLGVLTALGALAFGGVIGPGIELSIYLKRFGLAAVLPLAISCFGSARLYRWIPIMLFLCILTMTVFSIFPEFRVGLMVVSLEIGSAANGNRAMGLISNPNDSAYVVICAVVVVIAMIFAGKRRAFWHYMLMVSATVACLITVVLSASRSAVLGILLGLFYYLLASCLPISKRALIACVFCLGGYVGIAYSSEFQQRMESALVIHLGEENVESRLQAQYVTLLSAIENPLGVGFSNFPEATAHLSHGMPFSAVEGSDSVYFDTLLASGFLGLATLLLLFFKCWKYQRSPSRRATEALLVLRAGCIAVSVFGLASVSPFSIFVSPIAFFMVGSWSFLKMGDPRATCFHRGRH